MTRACRLLIGSAAAGLALAAPAQAQRQCEWDGERTICTPGSSGLPAGRIPNLPPPPDPVAEKLAANLVAYDKAAVALRGGTRTADPWLALPAPASEAELSQRIDAILAAVWPEFGSRAVEAERLRQQAEFYEDRTEGLRPVVQRMRERRDVLPGWIAQKTPERANLERHVAEARELEAELTALALARVNDRASERHAVATLLALAPDPRVSAGRLAPVPTVTELPGAAPPPPSPLMVADQAIVPELPAPEEFELTLARPEPRAPVEDKLAAMWTVGVALQFDEDDIGVFQRLVPERRAEYETLLTARAELDRELVPLEAAGRRLEQGIERLNLDFRTALANQLNAQAALMTEVVVDMALDRAADRMHQTASEIAAAEGLGARVPASRSQALLDFARTGGRLLLPIAGHEAQWDAFVEVQEQTLSVLERAEGFMVEAARLAASGSPAEMERALERVFGSVEAQAYQYARTVGLSTVPDGEDKSALLEALERYDAKRRARDGG